MGTEAEVRDEISRVEKQLDVISVGGVPLGGYEAEWEELHQQLEALRGQQTPRGPETEPADLEGEAPQFLGRLLEKSGRLTEKEQFAQALEALDEAEKYAGENEGRLAMVAEGRRQVERARESWKKAQAERTEAALADEVQPLAVGVEAWVEEYWAKAPEAEGQVEGWLNRISARRRAEAAARAAEALSKELEPLWAECERAIAATEIVRAAETAREALEKAQAVEREYPEAEAVRELRVGAEHWCGLARGAAATAATTAQFERLWEEYEELRDKGYQELPHIKAVREAGRLVFGPDDRGQQGLALDDTAWMGEPLPAEEAIRQVGALATDYATEKAEERLELARQAMPGGPRHAHELLESVRSELFVPQPFQQDTQWRARLAQAEEYDRKVVQPALERRREAERLRDAAFGALDAMEGWDRLAEAERVDPLTPRLHAARETLRPRLVVILDDILRKAERLEARRRWAEASEVVQQSLARAQQDQHLADWMERLQGVVLRCEEGARREESVLQALAEIGRLVDEGKVSQAHERLLVLESQLAEDAHLYAEVGRLRNRIDGHLDLRALLDRAGVVHDTAASDDELQATLDALEEALERHRGNAQLVSMQRRVRARLLFRRAERGYGFEPFADVRAWYQSVVDDGGADAERAQQRLAAMKQDEEEAEATERLLAACLQDLTKNRYREVYELLRPLAERRPPLPQHERVCLLLGRAEAALVEETERRLEALQRRGRRRLDTRAIFETWDTLTELRPDRARKWDELVARCYVQLAQEAETTQEALAHWQQARKHVTRDSRWYSTIAAGQRRTEIEVVLKKAAALVEAPEQARALLDGLHDRFPDEPAVRLRLADVCIRMADWDGAANQLESARRLLGQAEGDAAAGLLAELSQLQERLEKEERLWREKQRIEASLKPENPLGDFQWARRKYGRLRGGETPARRRVLDGWWESLVDGVVEELEARWEEEQEKGTPLWEAGWLMLKVLALRKEHGRARELLRAVARQSLDLRGRVTRLMHQADGPPGAPAEEALGRQIDEVNRLLEESQAYCEIFRQRRGELQDLRPTDLDESLTLLRGRRDKLVGVDGLIGEARGLLSAAMRTGERRYWDQCEELINQVTGTFARSAPSAEASRHVRPHDSTTLGSHPTVSLLVREVTDARETRGRLAAYYAELPRAWKREDFERVRWLIEELRREDPGGRVYGLSNRRLTIEALEVLEVDVDQLEQMLKERTDQLGKLEGWADAARQVVRWRALLQRRAEVLPEDLPDAESEVLETLRALDAAVQAGDYWGAGIHYEALPVLADGGGSGPGGQPVQPIAELVQEAVKRAAFSEAFERCAESLCGSDLPPAAREVLQGENPDLNVDRALACWHEARNSLEGRPVSVRSRGGARAWSLLQARRWLEDLPLDAPDGEGVLSRRAGLALARGTALARVVEAWIAEAEAELEAIVETGQRYEGAKGAARSFAEKAGTVGRWWNRLWRGRERRDLLQRAQAAYDEAYRLCPLSAELPDLLSLIRDLQ